MEHLTRILREMGLDPRALKLEITESVLMRDAESAWVRTDLGVRFAIGDSTPAARTSRETTPRVARFRAQLRRQGCVPVPYRH